jgi:hypothetical protein
MHRHERTVRELLQKVLSDFDEPEKDLILFVIQRDYHIALDEPASHRLSSIKESLHLVLGNSAPPVLKKFETLVSEAS